MDPIKCRRFDERGSALKGQIGDCVNRLMKWFEYDHFPGEARTSRLLAGIIHTLAHTVDEVLPESAEKTAGLRKLLEAKDCFVRAAVEAAEPEEPEDDAEAEQDTPTIQPRFLQDD